MIIVVDDQDDAAKALVRLLKHAGHEASHVTCGPDLVKQLHEGPLPSLIILDVSMPDMDGMECLREIRRRPEWAHLSVIMYSADLAGTRMQEALELGALSWLVKGSVSWAELIETVNKHVHAK